MGGWVEAADLPIQATLMLAEDHLRKEANSSHAKSLQIWASTLSLYSMGGEIPDPPEPPED